jgi:hypothetical protein
MKPIAALNLGFSDAENYRRRENKELLNRIFIKNQPLQKLCSKETFFLVGEKGTGKTAYSVFLQNNIYDETKARVFYIRETEYQSFVAIKNEKHLVLSDYVEIWKVILCVLIAKSIEEKDITPGMLTRFAKLRDVQRAIDTYYESAFAPEIVYALNFLKESKIAAELIATYARARGEEKEAVSFSESRFQMNLLYIERKFKEALASVKISQNLLVLIDGIDIRPPSIPFDEYTACIKGLANAVWSLNNDFFPTVRDTPGRIRVVLLIRPDIFATLGLQNQNAKIRDHAALLDWRTTYQAYRTSELFLMADKVLSSQQEEMREQGQYWDYYFPYAVKNFRNPETTDSSFISFLRYSFCRPRDIVTMLVILKDIVVAQQGNEAQVFCEENFDSPEFRGRYGDYLMGEIKDHLAFYYTEHDYELFLKFFDFLKGKPKFDYAEYVAAFSEFEKFMETTKIIVPEFCGSPNSFLQFLYELNILAFTEQREAGVFHQWCFRERSYSNIAPKVKIDGRYEIHHGVANALNTGSRLTPRRRW